MSAWIAPKPDYAEVWREPFRTKQPDVMTTFGESAYLFQRWWQDVAQVDPIDSTFVEAYCTNDRFLKNRLILPEEIPLLVLPLLKTILHRGYQQVFFLERGTYPYLWAIRRLIKQLGVSHVQLQSVRVKGMTRETFACNLLTLAGMSAQDTHRLAQPLSERERAGIRMLLRQRDSTQHHSIVRHLETYGHDVEEILRGSRTQVIMALSDIGLDQRSLMPNILKSIVFQVGNRLLEGPLTLQELYSNLDAGPLAIAPKALEHVQTMLQYATGSEGDQVALAPMLDWMHRYIRRLRGTLTHTARCILNVLLEETQTAATFFGPKWTLFVDEVSVCGSACMALEVIGKAFNPHSRFDFGAIVGMWVNACMLDTVCVNFFEFKPLEDVPFLSPHFFAPVFADGACEPVRPQRFPSCAARGRKLQYWERQTFSEALLKAVSTVDQRGEDEEEIQRLEADLVSTIGAYIDWRRFPVIRRRADHNPDVLSAMVTYYLGNFVVSGEQTLFCHDPLWEARLETVLGFSGRFQKSFYWEMDQFFAWLHTWETRCPETFAALRAMHTRHAAGIQRRILRQAVEAHQQYLNRMQQGMEALERQWHVVQRFLFSKHQAPTREVQIFRALLPQLQRELT